MNQQDAAREEQLKQNLDRIRHKIIVLSGKGGVGKSTLSVNLAYGLALSAKTAGILDIDLHGPSIARMLGIEGRMLEQTDGQPGPVRVHDNLFAMTIASLIPDTDEPVIWRGPLKMGAIRQFLQDILWPPLDFLVIDCPPGTGDEPLSAIQLLGKVDGAVIVSTPQDVAFLDARKTINFAKKLNVPVLGLVENMAGFFCPHCGEKVDLFTGEGAKKAARDFNLDILGTIPFDPAVVRTTDQGRPYVYDYGKTTGAREFLKIAQTIIEKVEKS